METIENIYASMFREYDDIQAARGCNQYKHKPGCPDADGSNSKPADTSRQKNMVEYDTIEREAKAAIDKSLQKTKEFEEFKANASKRFKKSGSISTEDWNEERRLNNEDYDYFMKAVSARERQVKAAEKAGIKLLYIKDIDDMVIKNNPQSAKLIRRY